MNRWEEVHRLHDRESQSIREIARRLSMSRNTVRKLLALRQPPSNEPLGLRSLLDPYKDTILELLKSEPTMPATVMRKRLVELGYTGGISILRDYLVIVRPQFVEPPAWKAVAPIEATIGQESVSVNVDGSEIDLSHLLSQPGAEAGMILISADFEIVAVSRVHERLKKRSGVELLGKKCYEEFERSDRVCPDCPGAAALATGRPQTAEITALASDGCQYMLKLTAYPIIGPVGQPVGFVEVEEDITEQKRSARLVGLLDGLETSLAAVDDISSLARHALNAAFSLEGVDFGCAYVRDQAQGEYRTIAQRGVSRDLAQALARQATGPIAGSISAASLSPMISELVDSERPTAVALVPITHDGTSVARLLVGSSTYAEFPSITLAALDALGKMAGGAIAGFTVKRLQRVTRAYLKSLLYSLPLPVWCVDDTHEVILWNRAAERVFGWKEEEVLHSSLEFLSYCVDSLTEWLLPAVSIGPETGGNEFQCLSKQGRPLRVVVTAMPLPHVIGPECAELGTIIVAEVSDAEPAASFTHAGGTENQTSVSERGQPVATQPTQSLDPTWPRRVLVIDHDEEQRRILAEILTGMGSTVEECGSAASAITMCVDAAMAKNPIDVVISELLPPAGCGGLELATSLMRIDPQVRVILSADSAIAGLEGHGLAGALRRPFTKEAVQSAMAGLPTGNRVG